MKPAAALLALALGLCLAAPLASAMEVAEAYASIPHRRTPYDPATSPSAANQKASLARLFGLTDRGVVLRVQGMKAHAARDEATLKRVVNQYDALIADLKREGLAPEVEPARPLIIEALRLQQRHFGSRPAGGLVFVRNEIASIPDVRQSSGKLHRAYSELLRAFQSETPRNRTSFFDHLCALDFL
jgi:hypothetical protein